MADTIVSLCSGIGGLDLGLHAGLRAVGRTPRTVCMVEREAFSAATLVKAMQASQLDSCPIWLGDIKDLPLDQLPRTDWITGGYPCQPFSVAGKRRGADDPRHLWPSIRKTIHTLRPRGVFFENVGGHITLGLDQVLQDLESDGFRCSFGLFTAAEVGAPHRRQRLFILGLDNSDGDRHRSKRKVQARRNGTFSPSKDVADGNGWRQPELGTPHDHGPGIQAGDHTRGRNPDMADPDSPRLQGWEHGEARRAYQWPLGPGSEQGPGEPCRTLEPNLGRDADGAANRVDRLRALGNGVVPLQAERAFTTLWDSLT